MTIWTIQVTQGKDGIFCALARGMDGDWIRVYGKTEKEAFFNLLDNMKERV